jgi:hypothetical protein
MVDWKSFSFEFSLDFIEKETFEWRRRVWRVMTREALILSLEVFLLDVEKGLWKQFHLKNTSSNNNIHYYLTFDKYKPGKKMIPDVNASLFVYRIINEITESSN